MDLRWLGPEERPALTRYIAERNVPGRQLCLHLADRPEDVAADLDELAPLAASCLILGGHGPSAEWRGVVAWEVGGPAGDRAWLFGPWTAAGALDVHVALLRAALAHLPSAVTRVDNFVDVDFATGLAAHAAVGFDPRRTVHILRAVTHRPVAPPEAVGISTIGDPSPADRAALVALHDQAFPGTHTGVDGMLGSTSGRLWCARADALVGYIYATRADASPSGTVEYVAVHPSARGQGIGRALLSTAVGWLLAEGASEVFLTVDADNDRALGVYRAAAFEGYRSGRALTLRRPVGPA